MHAKKLLSLLLSALAAVTLLASCGSRWDYSREAVKAANEAQGETLRVEFQVDQKFTNALHDAVEENIQPADVEKAMLADASLKELLTSGYRLNVYALRADVDAEEAARTIAEEQILPRLSGCKDEGVISMVKADNNYFYEAVLTYKEGGSGGGGGHEPGKPDDKPEEPDPQPTIYTVETIYDTELGTVEAPETVEEGGEVTFTVEPNDDVTVVSITVNDEAYDEEILTHTISNVQSNITITVEFKLEPPVFPVEWNAATGTLTFQVGSDGTTAATAMGSDELNLTNAKAGLHQQVEWYEKYDPDKAFELENFTFQDVQSLVVESGSDVHKIPANTFAASIYPDENKDSKLKTVKLSGVTEIGMTAFANCINLKEVTLTDASHIEMSAFVMCGITNLDISGNSLNLAMAAFNACRQLTSVKLSGDNITIGVSAFSECGTLEKVEIIGNLTSVYVGAFSLSPDRLSSATIYYEGGAEAFEKACKTYPDGNLCTLEKVGLSEDNFPAKT